MYALFTKVDGVWRFGGILEDDLIKYAHVVKKVTEEENGPGTFRCFDLEKAVDLDVDNLDA